MRFVVTLSLFLLISIPIISAESDTLDVKITAIELVDSDGDQRNDTVRVVVTTRSEIEKNIEISLIAEAGSDQLRLTESIYANKETTVVAFNLTAWVSGPILLSVLIDHLDGSAPEEIEIGGRMLSSGLQGPTTSMRILGAGDVWKGLNCELEVLIQDDTAERYDLPTNILFAGSPEPVILSHGEHLIDCSSWPQGLHNLRLSTTNALGGESESILLVEVLQPPPPSFEYEVIGNNSEAGTICFVNINLANNPVSDMTNIEISTPFGLEKETSGIDCTTWGNGTHLITVKAIDINGRITYGGISLVRLVPGLLTEEGTGWVNRQQASAFEPDVVNPSIWAPLVIGGGIAFIVLLVLGMRFRSEDPIEKINKFAIDAPTPSIDAEIKQDEFGQWWQRHSDGRVEWWDDVSTTWVKF